MIAHDLIEHHQKHRVSTKTTYREEILSIGASLFIQDITIDTVVHAAYDMFSSSLDAYRHTRPKAQSNLIKHYKSLTLYKKLLESSLCQIDDFYDISEYPRFYRKLATNVALCIVQGYSIKSKQFIDSNDAFSSFNFIKESSKTLISQHDFDQNPVLSVYFDTDKNVMRLAKCRVTRQG